MPRRGIVPFLVIAALISLSTPLRAADKSVDALAKEGYWGEPAQWETHSKLLNKPAPKLDLSQWHGKEIKVDDMKGKILVVDYWATWCGPCIAAIPHNNEIARKYADKGVLVIGACGSGRGEEKMVDVATTKNMEYPTARVSNESTKAWGVQWWPHYVVVDRKGMIRAAGIQPDFVEKVVEAIIKEQGDGKKAANAAPIDGASGAAAAQLASATAGGAAKAQIPAAWLEGEPAKRVELNALQGKPAPALQTTQWVNADAMNLADLKGKVVLLDFWATWCGPCIAAIPHTNELQQKYKDKGLVIIGVCHPQGVEKMAEMAKDKGIAYPVTADAEGKTIKAYKVNSYPDYYFIDRAGNLRIADCVNGKVDEAIELLLAETAP